VLDQNVARFVLASLPAAPARVLEVGAGEGELAEALRSSGYDVVAIDPASSSPNVRPVALHELREPAKSFDAAVAVVAMHHVEPLRESCRRLAEVVRPGGRLVLDEIDVDRLDERAAQWWLEQHGPGHGERSTPEEIISFLRHHIHDLTTIEDGLVEYYSLGPGARGPYLYRWELGPELRGAEQKLIAAGRLPAVGVRLVGIRRPDRA
jgi:SAM-dependent methyltransferase